MLDQVDFTSVSLGVESFFTVVSTSPHACYAHSCSFCASLMYTTINNGKVCDSIDGLFTMALLFSVNSEYNIRNKSY